MTRRHYPECRVVVAAWEDQDALDCEDAEVWIEDGSILVSYFDEDGIVVLEGTSDSAGGWTLTARSRARHATLSPMEGDGGILAGSIEEGGYSVDWTLRLSADPSRGVPDETEVGAAEANGEADARHGDPGATGSTDVELEN